MDLWIRSQDELQLVKCDNLSIACQDNYFFITDNLYHIVYRAGNNNYFDLGEYKTKKRALEVLDDIENDVFTINYKLVCNIFKIYNMPKE